MEPWIFLKEGGRHHELVQGRKYNVWFGGEYLGIGTYTEDAHYGSVFVEKLKIEGEEVISVFKVDEWTFAGDLVADEPRVAMVIHSSNEVNAVPHARN